jgi:hypothetical protein
MTKEEFENIKISAAWDEDLPDTYHELIEHVEELRAFAEYIFLANPFPDLSYHKHKAAFDLLEKKANKVLGKEESDG